MGDDDDGKVLAKLKHKLLHFRRGDGVKGGAGFVHEDDLRTDRDGARDAEALLLASGKAEGTILEAVLDLVPEGGFFQATFYGFIKHTFLFDSLDAEAIGNIVVDAFRERVVFLKDHADLLAKLDG